MPRFDIKLDEEDIKKLVAEGVLAQLSEESKNTLIKEALAFLLNGPNETDAYGRPVTRIAPITQAFQIAAQRVANDVVEELLTQNSEFQSSVRKMVTDTLHKAMGDEDDDYDYDFEQIVLESLVKALRRAWRDAKDHR